MREERTTMNQITIELRATAGTRGSIPPGAVVHDTSPARSSRRRIMIASVLGLAATIAIGCAHHVLLVEPSSPGPRGSYVCTAASGCRADPATDESRFNQSGTSRITLPAECGNRIHRILIQNANSDQATAIVECSAPGTDIGSTTLPDAGSP